MVAESRSPPKSGIIPESSGGLTGTQYSDYDSESMHHWHVETTRVKMLQGQPPTTCFSIGSRLEGETSSHPCRISRCHHMTKDGPKVKRSRSCIAAATSLMPHWEKRNPNPFFTPRPIWKTSEGAAVTRTLRGKRKRVSEQRCGRCDGGIGRPCSLL